MSDSAKRKLTATSTCVANCRSDIEKCDGEGEKNRCSTPSPGMGAECNCNPPAKQGSASLS